MSSKDTEDLRRLMVESMRRTMDLPPNLDDDAVLKAGYAQLEEIQRLKNEDAKTRRQQRLKRRSRPSAAARPARRRSLR